MRIKIMWDEFKSQMSQHRVNQSLDVETLPKFKKSKFYYSMLENEQKEKAQLEISRQKYKRNMQKAREFTKRIKILFKPKISKIKEVEMLIMKSGFKQQDLMTPLTAWSLEVRSIIPWSKLENSLKPKEREKHEF